jgi:retron-type reverse transcriptase
VQFAVTVPSIKDRVVQTAAKIVLEPIFEADMEPSAYGYRPKRSAQDAIRKVHKLICEGYTDVVDADLSKYFDTIPHCELMQCVAQRIVDRDVLRLIKMWLQAPVEERDENGKRRLTGGKDRHCGTPQGGVASPMLANLYMNRLLKGWRNTKRGEQFDARIVNYVTRSGRIVTRGMAIGIWGQARRRKRWHASRKRGKPSGAQQHGDLGGGAEPAESDSERLVGVLQLRNPDSGVRGG